MYSTSVWIARGRTFQGCGGQQFDERVFKRQYILRIQVDPN